MKLLLHSPTSTASTIAAHYHGWFHWYKLIHKSVYKIFLHEHKIWFDRDHQGHLDLTIQVWLTCCRTLNPVVLCMILGQNDIYVTWMVASTEKRPQVCQLMCSHESVLCLKFFTLDETPLVTPGYLTSDLPALKRYVNKAPNSLVRCIKQPL